MVFAFQFLEYIIISSMPEKITHPPHIYIFINVTKQCFYQQLVEFTSGLLRIYYSIMVISKH